MEGLVTEVLVIVLEFVSVDGKLVDDCVSRVGTDDNILADLVEEVINGVVDL